MKSFVLILFTVSILSFAARAGGDTTTIEKIVYQWNELHNTGNASAFRDLYNYSVLFYGNYQSREQCVNIKREFLLDSHVHKIISPISINFYSSGTIKCSFKKEINDKESIKEYSCYLLLEKRGNKYIITGESDLVTDQSLHFNLDPGPEIKSGSQSTSSPGNSKILIICLASIAMAVLIYYIIRNKKIIVDPGKPMREKKEVAVPAPELLRIRDGEKADPFEKFVVERFDPAHFEVLAWRTDTDLDGRLLKSNKHPDLEIRFRNGDYSLVFDVECKWRKDFYNEKLVWAKPHQWDTYSEFEHSTGKPVFVVIGIGGDPAKPDNVFILPLKKINSTELSALQLKIYKRLNDGNFFFDHEKLTLR